MKEQFDAIIILGRGISSIGELPRSIHACVQRAYELYNQKVAPHIIVSGKWSRGYDFKPPFTEARAMKKLAQEQGIPSDVIITEESSMDTISNFYYIKTQILIPNKWKKVLLITLPRLGTRQEFLMKKIFGPDFICETIDADFMFSNEIQSQKIALEKVKLKKLKEFLNNIEEGDHEFIFQAHIDYVNKHSK